MESSTEEEYGAFEEKVKRSVYVDNLSPHVTVPILRSAFGQFGNVKNISFIPSYLEPRDMSRAALVEMQNAKQAEQIILGMSKSPFMVSGMPRPVRACPAEPNMFDDRPRRVGRTIEFRWLNPNDPDFEVAKRMKNLVRKHEAEASVVLEAQLEEERKLANLQEQTLKAHYKKYEMIENVVSDGAVDQLAHHYKMSISADRFTNLEMMGSLHQENSLPCSNAEEKSKEKISVPIQKKDRSKKNGKGQDKGTCFHCSTDGHWKRNCPKYLESLKVKPEQESEADMLTSPEKLRSLHEESILPCSYDKGKDEETISVPVSKKDKSKSNGKDQDKGTCFHCKKDGHWKRNCPEYLESLKVKRQHDSVDRFSSLEKKRSLLEESSLPCSDEGKDNDKEKISVPLLKKHKSKEIGKKQIPLPKKDKSKKSGKVQEKGTCFQCKKDGHWKRNCPEYLESLKVKRQQDSESLMEMEREVLLKRGGDGATFAA